jgi:hypothetical protein
MMPNPSFSEQVAQAHHEDLLREAEQRRLLADLPPPGPSRSARAAGQLGTHLLKLGVWLKQFEQPPAALD